MKKLKFSLALMMAAFISFSALAQQQTTPAKAAPEVKTADQNASPKQEWLKHYNEIKLQVDKYVAKVKQNGANHTDFAQETKRLDQVTRDFKSKIDEWDNATQEERDRYSATMKQFYARVQQQADKVKVMYDKIRSDAATKQSEQK